MKSSKASGAVVAVVFAVASVVVDEGTNVVEVVTILGGAGVNGPVRGPLAKNVCSTVSTGGSDVNDGVDPNVPCGWTDGVTCTCNEDWRAV